MDLSGNYMFDSCIIVKVCNMQSTIIYSNLISGITVVVAEWMIKILKTRFIQNICFFMLVYVNQDKCNGQNFDIEHFLGNVKFNNETKFNDSWIPNL